MRTHHGRHSLVLAAAALLTACTACAHDSGNGRLNGTATARITVSGTVRAVGGPRTAPADPLTGTAVLERDGTPVARQRLDAHGRYTLTVPAGTYRLRIRDTTVPCPAKPVTAAGRNTVTVDLDCSRK